MSLTCEQSTTPTNIHSNEDEEESSKNPQHLTTPGPIIKHKDQQNYEDDEELDFEEEVEQIPIKSSLNDDHGDQDNENEPDADDGELQDEEGQLVDNKTTKSKQLKKKKCSEKDEGEIDSDEELEEGEVKESEDEDQDANSIDSEKNPKSTDQSADKTNDSNSQTRRTTDNLRKPYQQPLLSLPPTSSSYYHSNNSRYQRNDYAPPLLNRYNMPIRVNREPLLPPSVQHASSTSSSTVESAWERGLKQARELISRASKRKEEDEDFEDKRYNLSLKERSPPDALLEPPMGKRRRHSQHSSSEDEIERRHRLAYDAAPWNHPAGSSSGQQSSGNYYNRRNYSTYNRSADTYRDPWRRSKSPRNRSRNDAIGPATDSRYGEPSSYNKREKELDRGRRSDSMSSLSSICSSSSNSTDRSGKSSGRKLPYTRPHLESASSSRNKDDPFYDRDYGKSKSSRFDRIPKKPSATTNAMNKDDDQKSFDSWSESLSDSSSYYSNSDSDDDDNDNDNNASTRDYIKNKHSASNKNRSLHGSRDYSSSSRIPSSRNRHQLGDEDGRRSKQSTITKTAQHEPPVKVPIKMTFMKKQQSLKKDNIIDEQLNGNISDGDGDNSRLSHKGANHPPRLSFMDEDETERVSDFETNDDLNDNKVIASPKAAASPSSSASSSSTTSSKERRRKELMIKLKAVEAAIKRKLDSKS